MVFLSIKDFKKRFPCINRFTKHIFTQIFVFLSGATSIIGFIKFFKEKFLKATFALVTIIQSPNRKRIVNN
jgi:hypothetical protein